MTTQYAKLHHVALSITARVMDRIEDARNDRTRAILKTDIERDVLAELLVGEVDADPILASKQPMPTPRAPDWTDLWERYHNPYLCTCRGDSGPCRHCKDGWQDDVDWELERRTTGYVLELDGVRR